MENEDFTLSKNHTISKEKHSYNKVDIIKRDFKNLSKNEIIKKFDDYEYLSDFLKVFAILNVNECCSYYKLKQLFEREYGEIIIKYDLINDDYKKKSLINILKEKN